MTDDQQQTVLTADVTIAPQLQLAIETWYEARLRFQREPMKQTQDAYSKVTDELGQAFSQWEAEQPELVEQLRFWFVAHPEG